MDIKTARLTLLIDPNKKAAFDRLCASQDRTPSQVVRQLIRNYLLEHGIDYTVAQAERPRAAGTKPRSNPPAASRPGLPSRTGQRRR